MSVTINELGCAGHFIGARNCAWRRHTQIIGSVDSFRVSSVGDYRPSDSREAQTLGASPESFYETAVFRLTSKPAEGSEGCGCLEPVSWMEMEMRRCATAGEAQRQHHAMVIKYSSLADKEQS